MISYISTKGRNKFYPCEDSLTSTVIDFLKYLPTPMFWGLLKKSMYYQKLPKFCGEILNIKYWESWNADNTDNSTRVELISGKVINLNPKKSFAFFKPDAIGDIIFIPPHLVTNHSLTEGILVQVEVEEYTDNRTNELKNRVKRIEIE